MGTTYHESPAALTGSERRATVVFATSELPQRRRDFIFVATATVGAIGSGLAVWPLIHQMNPDASVLALTSTDVELADVEIGASVTVKWQGKPVFIRHRTPDEVAAARETPWSS